MLRMHEMRGLNERIDSSWNDDTSAITQSFGPAATDFA